jgi:hypothetical protein
VQAESGSDPFAEQFAVLVTCPQAGSESIGSGAGGGGTGGIGRVQLGSNRRRRGKRRKNIRAYYSGSYEGASPTGREFFDPPTERHVVVLVDSSTVRKAERLIESCEHCDPDVEIPFDNILDRVTGSDPSVTDYILETPAKCPYCKREVFEKTLVEPA